jgi:hypothetical protein
MVQMGSEFPVKNLETMKCIPRRDLAYPSIRRESELAVWSSPGDPARSVDA